VNQVEAAKAVHCCANWWALLCHLHASLKVKIYLISRCHESGMAGLLSLLQGWDRRLAGRPQAPVFRGRHWKASQLHSTVFSLFDIICLGKVPDHDSGACTIDPYFVKHFHQSLNALDCRSC